MLEFYARKRKNNDGHFLFSVGDIEDQVVNNHKRNRWTQYSYNFTAVDTMTTLGFLSGQGGGDTTGHYLDKISVTEVPEPGIVGLLGVGLLGLFAARRKAL